MEMPGVVTEVTDSKLNFTFCVRAYRKVTEAEMSYAYAVWRGQKKSNKPKKNQRVEIWTIIGCND